MRLAREYGERRRVMAVRHGVSLPLKNLDNSQGF
jgi:hypothetical protein